MAKPEDRHDTTSSDTLAKALAMYPAFPRKPWESQGGLNVREYAAIHILAGMFTNNYTVAESVAIAVNRADALIAELTKRS